MTSGLHVKHTSSNPPVIEIYSEVQMREVSRTKVQNVFYHIW